LCENEDTAWKQAFKKPEGLKNKELPIATIILALGQRFQKLAS
jgi:hypothetical protein